MIKNVILMPIRDEDASTLQETFRHLEVLSSATLVVLCVNGGPSPRNQAVPGLAAAYGFQKACIDLGEFLGKEFALAQVRRAALEAVLPRLTEDAVIGFLDADCRYPATVEACFERVRRSGAIGQLGTSYFCEEGRLAAIQRMEAREQEVYRAFMAAGSKIRAPDR